jgi:aminoglycoside phosphotransferase
MSLRRPNFATREEYGRYFTDPHYWHLYVDVICERHGLGRDTTIHAGFPGTNPVFIVDEKYAIKLYTDLFDGARSFPVEREIYGLIATEPAIPAPALIVAGKLFDEDDNWPWPYIITQVIPGRSMSESQISATDQLAIAAWLGQVVRRIHSLPLARSGPLQSGWEAFAQFLAAQRTQAIANHARWSSLPTHLIAQIEGYLPTPAELIDERMTPALIHCDLNSDHVLGEEKAGRWQPCGIIDFGDTRVGDRVYELVALHMGLFYCSGRLLRTFLDAYGFDEALRHDFVRRAMSMTLLFEHNVFSHVFQNIPAAASASTLEELAELAWRSAFAPHQDS